MKTQQMKTVVSTDEAVQIVYDLAVAHAATRKEKEAVRVFHDWFVNFVYRDEECDGDGEEE